MPIVDIKSAFREPPARGKPPETCVDWDKLPKVFMAYVDAIVQRRMNMTTVNPSRYDELRYFVAKQVASVWNAGHRQGRKELTAELFSGDYLPPDPGFRDKVRDGQVTLHDHLKEIAEKLA